jgi:hypothetical protein
MSELKGGFLEIRRLSQYGCSLSTFDVVVDGTQIGGVKNGESKVFEVLPGQHRVLTKIGKSGTLGYFPTPVVTINVLAGETTSLVCGTEVTGLKLLFMTAYVLFMPDKILYLKTQ